MTSPSSLRRVRSWQSPAVSRAAAVWRAAPFLRSSRCCRRTEPRPRPLLRARLRARSRQRWRCSCPASDVWARPALPDRRARASENGRAAAAAPAAGQAPVAAAASGRRQAVRAPFRPVPDRRALVPGCAARPAERTWRVSTEGFHDPTRLPVKGHGPQTLRLSPCKPAVFKGPPEGAMIAIVDPQASRRRDGGRRPCPRCGRTSGIQANERISAPKGAPFPHPSMLGLAMRFVEIRRVRRACESECARSGGNPKVGVLASRSAYARGS